MVEAWAGSVLEAILEISDKLRTQQTAAKVSTISSTVSESNSRSLNSTMEQLKQKLAAAESKIINLESVIRKHGIPHLLLCFAVVIVLIDLFLADLTEDQELHSKSNVTNWKKVARNSEDRLRVSTCCLICNNNA